MAVYLPVQAINRSQKVRLGKGSNAVLLAPGVTSYVDITDGNIKRDIQRHSAIGAILIVGALTGSNSDFVVTTGGVVSAGSGLNVNVSAGELRQRSTGVNVAGASATNDALTDSTSSGQSIYYVVTWDNTSGAVGLTAGTAATTGTQVVPATPAGKTALANVLFAHGASAPGTITDVRPRP